MILSTISEKELLRCIIEHPYDDLPQLVIHFRCERLLNMYRKKV